MWTARTLRHAVAGDLRSLLAGIVDAEVFQPDEYWGWWPSELGGLFGNIEHYLADADLRAKCPDYRAMQQESLRRVIEALEWGDLETANEVSFLTWPD